MDYDYYGNYSDQFYVADFNSTLASNSKFNEYVFVPILVVIGIVGLLGNSALIFIVYKSNARSTVNAFIQSLAVADLIVIIFHMPFVRLQSFPFGNAVCKLFKGSNDIATGVTSFSLTALTVYCFFETTSTPQSWTSRTTAVVVAGVWVLALIAVGPAIYFAQVFHENNEADSFCHSIDGRRAPLRFAMYYACPLIAFGFFYCIARLGGTLNRQTVAQRQVSTLTIWLIVVYASCFFLEYMTIFWNYLPPNDNEFWNILDIIGLYIALAYRCLNPCVVYCVSGNFRQLFDRYFLCWCTKINLERFPEAERNRPLC